MSLYKNFKTVTYCVAQWADHITEDELRVQADWLQKYVGIDKVYLETYRDVFARKEQLLMIKRVLEEYGIEVSGGITTVTPPLNDDDKKLQRLFGTFCYCNTGMRDRLKEISEYTASLFDEFIIDDFFFTQCMCDDCRREKGNRSWAEFRLAKMLEVSENLILGPAKKVNPKCRVIIKYPNWRESYHETGYNPMEQRHIFDSIYTGTEARHSAQQDQHLQRYLSYSLPRYMEHVAPGRNGGGWFDPFDCDRIDTYLEQAYLTAFSRSKELMMFCWPMIYNNRRATPLGFQYQKIDALLSQVGNPTGLKVYVPFNASGEDHIEDYLGMAGIPVEPVSDFPEYDPVESPAVLVTAAAFSAEAAYEPSEAATAFTADGTSKAARAFKAKRVADDILDKIADFASQGGRVIVTSGFVIAAQKHDELAAAGALSAADPLSKAGRQGAGIRLSDLTSVRYTNRRLDADEFQADMPGTIGRQYVKTASPISFPLLEHRNNASWSICNAGHGEYHESLIMYETYGKGRITVLNLPDMPSRIYDLPKEVLTTMRYELTARDKVWIDAESGISLFTYDNGTFALYCYANDGCKPLDFNIYFKIEEGKPVPEKLKILQADENAPAWGPRELEQTGIAPVGMFGREKAAFFHGRLSPGEFVFLKAE